MIRRPSSTSGWPETTARPHEEDAINVAKAVLAIVGD